MFGLCKSPSRSNTFERQWFANVKAKFVATKVFPSLVKPLVTCNDFISFWRRMFSRRVTRARNFSAPRLRGSESATKRAEGGAFTLTEAAPSSSVDAMAELASSWAVCGNRGVCGWPCSFPICRRASYTRLIVGTHPISSRLHLASAPPGLPPDSADSRVKALFSGFDWQRQGAGALLGRGGDLKRPPERFPP